MKKIMLFLILVGNLYCNGYSNDKIAFNFPDVVNKHIYDYIEKRQIQEFNKLFIVCSSNNDTTTIRICNYSTDKKSSLGKILHNTNRYFRYHKIDIPIIFSQDLMFSEFVQDIEYDEKGRKGIKRSIFILSGQEIAFYSKGYNTFIVVNRYFQQ